MRKRSQLTELDAIEGVLSQSILNFVKVDEDGCEVQHKVKLFFEAEKGPLDQYAHTKLTEENIGATLTSVTVCDLHEDTLILKPDNFSIRYYKAKTLNKACDYLLLTSYGDEKYAIFIDLKTTIHEAPCGDNKFNYLDQLDAEMVWQMAGADAMFDTLIDVVTKKSNTHRMTTVGHKKNSAQSELANYKRRYIILYKKIRPSASPSTTGTAQLTTSYQMPNPYALERDVRAVNVENKATITIGDLVSWC